MSNVENIDAQLEVVVKDDKLVISVGLNILTHACEHGFEGTSCSGAEITDKCEFAKDLATELKVEEDDGTTRVHKMLDAAGIHITEDGCSSAVKLPEESEA